MPKSQTTKPATKRRKAGRPSCSQGSANPVAGGNQPLAQLAPRPSLPDPLHTISAMDWRAPMRETPNQPRGPLVVVAPASDPLRHFNRHGPAWTLCAMVVQWLPRILWGVAAVMVAAAKMWGGGP